MFEKMVPNHGESPASVLLERMNLTKGVLVRLTKVRTLEGTSAVAVGSVLEGALDERVELGKSIYLDGGKQNTSSIDDIVQQGGKVFIKTRTSVYELTVAKTDTSQEKTIITKSDLENELKIFKGKGYGEWDMVGGRVRPEDDPYQRVLLSNGFKEGDWVTFFAEKERVGIIRGRENGEMFLEDEHGNPWGLTILQNGWIKRT